MLHFILNSRKWGLFEVNCCSSFSVILWCDAFNPGFIYATLCFLRGEYALVQRAYHDAMREFLHGALSLHLYGCGESLHASAISAWHAEITLSLLSRTAYATPLRNSLRQCSPGIDADE